jgi:5-methylcytosine-specific restriction endonuclease McrA
MDASVLVLNANYEPINVCDTRRAIGLILGEKASLVLNGRGEIRTVSASFPLPSIIRLEQMVAHPRPRIKLTRREVFRRDQYACQYCGKHSPVLTIDHVTPRHLGGKHIWTNVVAACPFCNHRKGGRTLDEANMHLLRQPQEPPRSARYVFERHLAENAEWEPFISGW